MKSAFSLVELSIVLVILGLLTGGILTGQNLIRAAEIRSITTEFQSFQTATMTFRDKYFALPGDITNATDFWGAMTNCVVASPSGTGTQTCNGDGDGIIDNSFGTGRTGEQWAVWQHLANAGLIEGSYTGISGSGGSTHSVPGENVPAGKISSSAWSIRYIASPYVGGGNYFAGTLSNHYQYGGADSTSLPRQAILTAEEAWNIDKKIDDARPNSGIIKPLMPCTDNTGVSDVSATYDLDDTSIACVLTFVDVF